MAHPQQINFISHVRSLYPDYFNGKRVWDIGSLDINGNNKIFFTDCDYTGMDLQPGKNVDIIGYAHGYSGYPFDTIISTECLEHDQYWKLTLENAYRLLKPNGLLVMTCATVGRPEHGTRENSPTCSPFTPDYYHNLTIPEIESVLNPSWFSPWYIQAIGTDLQWYGIKK